MRDLCMLYQQIIFLITKIVLKKLKTPTGRRGMMLPFGEVQLKIVIKFLAIVVG